MQTCASDAGRHFANHAHKSPVNSNLYHELVDGPQNIVLILDSICLFDVRHFIKIDDNYGTEIVALEKSPEIFCKVTEGVCFLRALV